MRSQRNTAKAEQTRYFLEVYTFIGLYPKNSMTFGIKLTLGTA